MLCLGNTESTKSASILRNRGRNVEIITFGPVKARETPPNRPDFMKFTIPRVIPCKFHEIGVVFGVFPLISSIRELKNIKIQNIFSTGLDRNTRKVIRFWRSNVRNSFSVFRRFETIDFGSETRFPREKLQFYEI